VELALSYLSSLSFCQSLLLGRATLALKKQKAQLTIDLVTAPSSPRSRLTFIFERQGIIVFAPVA
jgi:hypothetical protein